MKAKDLTKDEFQGNSRHDQIDVLTEPGFYKIPINDGEGGITSINVEIVSIFIYEGTQHIVIRDKRHYYFILYYAGFEKCFLLEANGYEYCDYNDILDFINLDD